MALTREPKAQVSKANALACSAESRATRTGPRVSPSCAGRAANCGGGYDLDICRQAAPNRPLTVFPRSGHRAAVEQKYADTETKLKATIAQISDDVKGYTGDSDYNLFYAVFYVNGVFWAEDKFRTAWNEKKFPKSWRAFYVVSKCYITLWSTRRCAIKPRSAGDLHVRPHSTRLTSVPPPKGEQCLTNWFAPPADT